MLVARWRDGDAAAGDTLFGRHFSSIFRFFASKTAEAATEDLTQKTFMAVLGAREAFEGRSSFRTYLFGIARRQLLMHFRRDRVERDIFDPQQTSVAELQRSPSSLVAAKQEQQWLFLALRRLPVDYQIVVELFYWEGLKTAEISEVVEAAEGTVRSRLTRARTMLADHVRQIAASPAAAEATMTGFESWVRSLAEVTPRGIGGGGAGGE